MLIAIAALQFASAAYSVPTPGADLANFARFASANGACYGLSVDPIATIQAAQKAAMAHGAASEEQAREVVTMNVQLNNSLRVDDIKRFCEKTLEIYRSYDPAYLRALGIPHSSN